MFVTVRGELEERGWCLNNLFKRLPIFDMDDRSEESHLPSHLILSTSLEGRHGYCRWRKVGMATSDGVTYREAEPLACVLAASLGQS